MGVAAAGSVFHQPGIAGPENLGAPVAHADYVGLAQSIGHLTNQTTSRRAYASALAFFL